MAKTSILTILIKLAKTGNADDQTIKALAQIRNGISQAMVAFAAFAGAAYTLGKALDATVGTFVNYAAQVREMNRLTGSGAEETSRMIQMADDLTISYESLQKSLWFASKNGMDVSVDSLANLADQYTALKSPMAQAQLLAEKFGKSGMDMGKMLEQGGDKVREWAKSIDGSLVLTDRAVLEAREYELALDDLNDQWTAMKVSIGQAALPALNELMSEISGDQVVKDAEEAQYGLARALGMTITQYDDLGGSWNDYINQYEVALEYGRAWEASLAKQTETTQDLGKATEEVSQRNTDMLSVIMDLQSENDNYNESLASLNEKMSALTAEQSQYLAGTEEYNKLQAEIEQTGGAIEDLAAQHEDASRRIAFALIQQKMALDGFSDAEFDTLLALGEQWGILDHATVTAAQNMVREVDRLSGSTANALFTVEELHKRWSALAKLSGQDIDLVINMVVRQNQKIVPGGGISPAALATPMAEGGQLGDGWAIVGEKGFEIVSPSGYVFPHEQAKQLISNGFMPETQLASGGMLGSNTSSFLLDEDVRQYTYAGYNAPKPKKRRERGELSGGGGGGGGVADSSVASAVVSQAVTPLVESNLLASQSAQAAQQANTLEMRAARNAIETGNTLMAQLSDDIHNMNATNQQTIISALEQNRG